jgi:RNA polymerase sigma-70 factor (ECF subfamily)
LTPDFDSLVRQYGSALGRLAAAYVESEADRADLLQEILVALWRSMPRFRGDASERTFVFRVAQNRAITFRARQTRRPTIPMSDTLVDPRPGPDARVEAVSDREQLRRAILELPDSWRDVVVLHLEGFEIGEIASLQGCSENSVSVRLTRARKRLRDILVRDDVHAHD